VTQAAPEPAGPKPMPAFGARTDVGRVRATNEDRFVAHPPLFLVADGMGGQNAGEVAAAITADLLEAAAADGTIRTVADLAEALRRANAAVRRRAAGDRALEGMGTTCTAMLVAGSRLMVAHVGDSRAYLLRGGGLRQLTIDHTLMQRLVDEGRLRPVDIATHPQRSVVIRAIGGAADVAADELVIELEPGDRLLLCSDGLTGPLAVGEIEDALAGTPDPQAAAERLVELANAAGGADNVTALVVDPDRLTAASAVRHDAAPSPRAAGARPSGWRRRAVGALLFALTLGIAGLAAVVVLAPATPSGSASAAPAISSATPFGPPSLSPGPSSAPSPNPSLVSPPDLVPAPSPIPRPSS
jgi:serine/threonine protein phosphatase PrpC